MAKQNELIGKKLGQYKIDRQIGRGGMATVFRAKQAGLDRWVAVKVLPPQYAEASGFSERFKREARAIASLEHPHILPVYDYGQQDIYTYLVMRYIEGSRTLTQVMRQPLTFGEIVKYLQQVAAALDYAHKRGVIHRDIKPGNILLSEDDWTFLADFGLARMVTSTIELTSTGVVQGTPAYMSPEQAIGGKVDARTDIYAMGVIFFQMLTGQIPHQAVSPHAIIYKRNHEGPPSIHEFYPSMPKTVDDAIKKVLATSPKDRFASASEFIDSLIVIMDAYPEIDKIIELHPLEEQDETIELAPTNFPIPPIPPIVSVNKIDTLKTILKQTTRHASIRHAFMLFFAVLFIFVFVDYALSFFNAVVLSVVALLLLFVYMKSVDIYRHFFVSQVKSDSMPNDFKEAWPPTSYSNPSDFEETLLSTSYSNPSDLQEEEGTIFLVHQTQKDVFENKNHLIKDIQAKDIERISANLNREGGSRIILTGFGGFGGTSLVRGITAHLMRTFRNVKKALVIRFDITTFKQTEEYAVFINEDKGGFIRRFSEFDDVLDLVRKNIEDAERYEDFDSVDTFADVATVFDKYTQDLAGSARSEAIARLVWQLLLLLSCSDYDNLEIQNALKILSFFSADSLHNNTQLIMIFDCVDKSTVAEKLFNSPISNEKQYPWVSVIIVSHYERFKDWPAKNLLLQRKFAKNYIRRYWGKDFNALKTLNMVLNLDFSKLDSKKRALFEEWLLYLTYEARGSLISVLKQLRDGYWSKNSEQIFIDFEESYRQHKETIVHNAKVQLILENNWDYILDKSLLNSPEITDQARIGIYYLMDWMRKQFIFDDQSIVEATQNLKITISDNHEFQKETIIKLLKILQNERYLQYQVDSKKYRLTWQKMHRNWAWKSVDYIRGLIRYRDIYEPILSHNKYELIDDQIAINQEKIFLESGDVHAIKESPETKSILSIGLLCDATSQDERLNTLVTQIAFELLEAEFQLVFLGRGGVESVVRQRLKFYSILRQHDQYITTESILCITAKTDIDLVMDFLESVDLIVLAQKTNIENFLSLKKLKDSKIQNQVLILPVGAVGGVTRDLWIDINAKLEQYYNNKIDTKLFNRISILNEKEISEIARNVVKLTKQICASN